MLLAVKRNEGFTVVCISYDDLRAVEAGIIKSVHRLTVFKHNVVGYIYDVVDGANACGTESHSHPKGRRLDLYIFYDSCGVSVAKLGGVYSYGKVISDRVTVA